MEHEPNSQARDVVLLLTTWGATAQPGVAELLAALATFVRSDARGLVHAVLNAPGVVLPDGLRREASELLAASEDGTPAREATLTALVGRLGQAVQSAVDSARGTLRDELRAWSPLLDAAELNAVLQRLWTHEAAAEVADFLAAARQIEEARGILGKARWRVDGELRGLLDAADPDAAQRVGAVLEGGNPGELLTARRALVAATRGAVGSRQAQGVADASARVAALRDRARSLSGTADGTKRHLLAAALERVEATLADADSGAGAGETLLERLMLWEQTLGEMLEPARATRGDRAALGQALAAELREELARSPEAAGLAPALEVLEATVPGDGPAFVDAVAGACAALSAHRATRRAHLESVGAALRDSARRLEAELVRIAGDLPTDYVVDTRLLLERVEEAVAEGDPSAVESVTADVRGQLDRIGELSELGQRHRESRLTAERKRLRSEAHRLARVAGRASARRIEALVRRIDSAEGKALGRLTDDLERLSRSVGNSVRLRTARVLKRLERRGGQDEAVGRLREAFDGDDLATMAELEREKRRELARAARPRLILAGVATVAVACGAWWVLTSGAERAQRYELTLAASDTPCSELWLVQEGAIDHEVDCSTGRAEVSLKRGSYEVFVNRRYTGRVIRVPGAAEPDLQDIPVLPGP